MGFSHPMISEQNQAAYSEVSRLYGIGDLQNAIFQCELILNDANIPDMDRLFFLVFHSRLTNHVFKKDMEQIQEIISRNPECQRIYLEYYIK